MKKSNPNQEAIDLKKEIEKLDRKIMTLEFARAGSQRRLALICIHNETEKQHDYQEGGYLDREKYIDKVVCKICGTVLTEDIKVGGFC
jgi:hypothetical protein